MNCAALAKEENERVLNQDGDEASVVIVRAILPAAAFSGGQSRLKAGCGQDWPPSNY